MEKPMEKSKEKHLYDMVEDIFDEKFTSGNSVSGVLVIDGLDFDEGYICFFAEGVAFNVTREFICEPEEHLDFDDVDSDGHHYEFGDVYDGFKDITVDESIDLIKDKA